MPRGHKRPKPPQLFLCTNSLCRARLLEEELIEINLEDPTIFDFLRNWDTIPDHGCPRCNGWPVWKLKTCIKDFELADELAGEGMARAARGVTAEWKAAILTLVHRTARDFRIFASDDLYPEIHDYEYLNDGKDVNRSALGPIMRIAINEGWIRKHIVPTRKSKRPEHHGLPVRVWDSLL